MVPANETGTVSSFFPSRPKGFTDALLALGLGGTFTAFYTLTLQPTIRMDGPNLVDGFLYDEPRHWIHVGYLPVVRFLGDVLRLRDSIIPLRLISLLAAALGVVLVFGLARRFGAPRPKALFAAALVGLSPALWFHATLIEVHALHFGAVAVSAFATLCLSRSRPLLSSAVLGACAAVLFFSHQSGVLLLPGWALLAACACASPDGETRRPRALLASAVALGLGLGLALIVSGGMHKSGGLVQEVEAGAQFVAGNEVAFDARFAWEELLVPLGLLLPAALAGAVAGPLGRGTRFALGLLIVPSIVFFLWWGQVSSGGYLLGVLPFVGVLASLAPGPPRRWALPVAAVALCFQAWLGFGSLHLAQQRELDALGRARAEHVRELVGEEGYLFSLRPPPGRAQAYYPGIREVCWGKELMLAWSAGETSQDVTARLLEAVERLDDGTPGPMVLDLAFEHERGLPPRLVSYGEALRAALEGRYRMTLEPHADWPMLLSSDGTVAP